MSPSPPPGSTGMAVVSDAAVVSGEAAVVSGAAPVVAGAPAVVSDEPPSPQAATTSASTAISAHKDVCFLNVSSSCMSPPAAGRRPAACEHDNPQLFYLATNPGALLAVAAVTPFIWELTLLHIVVSPTKGDCDARPTQTSPPAGKRTR